MTKEQLEEAWTNALILLGNKEKWHSLSPETRLICVITCLCGVSCEEIDQEKLSIKEVNAFKNMATKAIKDMRAVSTSFIVPTMLN